MLLPCINSDFSNSDSHLHAEISTLLLTLPTPAMELSLEEWHLPRSLRVTQIASVGKRHISRSSKAVPLFILLQLLVLRDRPIPFRHSNFNQGIHR